MPSDDSQVGLYRLRDDIDFLSALRPKPRFHGLGWYRDPWGSQPRWIKEPDEDEIGEVMEDTFCVDGIDRVSLFYQGKCNTLYTVSASTGAEFIARLALPIDPGWKTISEVATIDWVRENTSLPTPRVLGFHASNQNAIGFEWIAMTDVQGSPLPEMWPTMSWEAKAELVIRIAEFAVESFRSKEFGQIGSLTFGPARQSPDGLHTGVTEVGRIVSPEFSWDESIHQVHSRGPYNDSRQWIAARLKAAEDSVLERLYRVSPPEHELTLERLLAMAESDEANEMIIFADFDSTFYIIRKLMCWFDTFFPYDPSSWESAIPEPTMLLHHKMDAHHILVENDGTLAAVVDWEDIAVMPKWMGCRYPSFLRGRDREHEPKRGAYHSIGPNSEYCKHKYEHELTKLRRVFMNAVYALDPTWVETWQSGVPRRDYDLALKYCHDPILKWEILAWLDDLDHGSIEANFRGLEWRMMKYPNLP